MVNNARWIRKKKQALENALRILRSSKHNMGNRYRYWMRLHIRYADKANQTA